MALLEFSFQTGAVSLTRIVNAMALTYGYQDTILDVNGLPIPNPMTKSQFAKAQIKRIIVEAVHDAERQDAINTAATAVTPIVLGD